MMAQALLSILYAVEIATVVLKICTLIFIVIIVKRHSVWIIYLFPDFNYHPLCK